MIILFALILFSAFRLALFVLHHATFEALSFGQILSAFFNGIRFDLSVIALFLGPVILLFNFSNTPLELFFFPSPPLPVLLSLSFLALFPRTQGALPWSMC